MAFGFATRTRTIAEAERIAGQRWRELEQVGVGMGAEPFAAPTTWTLVDQRLNVTIATVVHPEVPDEVPDEVFNGEILQLFFLGPDGWTDHPQTVPPGATIGIAVAFANIGNTTANFRIRFTGAMTGTGTYPGVPPTVSTVLPFVGTGPTAPGPVIVNVFLDVWVP